MKKALVSFALPLALLAGCSGIVLDAPTEPTKADAGTPTPTPVPAPDAATERDAAVPALAATSRTFMTRNVGLGFAVEPVLAAPSVEQIPIVVAEQWALLEKNDFAARASLLAAEVVAAAPDAIALQEVAIVQRMSASGAPPVELDYLTIVQAALAARGQKYVVAATQKDTDVTVPMYAGTTPAGEPILDGVRILDRDVVLVREGLRTSRPENARYAIGLPVSIGEGMAEVVRGWASIVIETDDGAFRFVNTHLEDAVPEARVAQAAELLKLLEAEKLPIVLAGDLNAQPGAPAHAAFTNAKYVDAWAQAQPADPGFTCCQDVDLAKTLPFTERIDYVLFHDPAGGKTIRGAVATKVIGNDPAVRTPKGQWASDHAGLVATFAPLERK